MGLLMATVLQLLAAQTQTPPAQTIFANVILDSGISTVFVRKMVSLAAFVLITSSVKIPKVIVQTMSAIAKPGTGT